MSFKYKLLAILLSGIVSFSCMDISSCASEVADPDTGANESSAESDAILNWPAGPSISAESAIVIEASTGTVLYSKNADARQYPASITKIMTALVALEHCSLDETVTFSRNAVYSIERDSSHIARTDGEELTMEQCLYAVMLESANECANAVAEHVAGSIEAFADMMNEKAAELGCTGTHFVNPHGLHDEDHYVTARDMALITREAIKNETFRTIAGAVRYTIPPTNKNDEELIMNHHHSMISKHRTAKYYDETVFAGKNGYTTDSLNTLVTCASRNDMDIIVVVLRCPSGTPYDDTAALLDYAEDNFSKCALPDLLTELPEDILQNISDTITGFQEENTFLDEDSCSYAVVPNGISLDDLHAALTSVDRKDDVITANISYTYEEVSVGTSTWDTAIAASSNHETLTQESAQQSDAQTDSPADQKGSELPGRILRIVLYVIGGIILLLLVIVLLLFIRTQQRKARRRRRGARRRRRTSPSRRPSSHSSRRRRESPERTASRRRSSSSDLYGLDELDKLDSFDDFDDFDF